MSKHRGFKDVEDTGSFSEKTTLQASVIINNYGLTTILLTYILKYLALQNFFIVIMKCLLTQGILKCLASA